MKRILIIGCPGSGKSTLARALREMTGLPIVYLDCLFWGEDAVPVPRELFLSRLEEALRGGEWIMDGNFRTTLPQRLERCDTVVFLDLPTDLCMEGILSRRGTKREDLPWVEDPDNVDEEFLDMVRQYETEQRPYMLDILARHPEKETHIFTSREDAAQWVESVRR